MRTKTSFLLATFFLAFTLAAPTAGLFAEGFRAAGFRYCKDVQPRADAVKAAGVKADDKKNLPVYGRIKLDQDIVRYSGEYDLVLAYRGRPQPAFRRPVPPPPGETGVKKPSIEHQGKIGNTGRFYVLRLPELPPDSQYVELEVNSPQKYEADVEVFVGPRPKELTSLGTRALYSYKQERSTRLKFESGNNRFVRLEFNSQDEFTFPLAHHESRRRVSEFKTELTLKDFKQSHDADTNSSVYYYENETRRKLHRLILTFKEKRFRRSLKIEVRDSNSKSYRYFMNASLARKSDEAARQVIDFSEPTSSELKLIIQNSDDRPLTLESVEAYSPLEELVFELPDATAEKDASAGAPGLRLYYGNPYLQRPSHDINFTHDKKLVHAEYEAGKHRVNDAFAYSALEPPVSTWIIRIIFVLGLLGLAYPAYRIFTSYARSVDEGTVSGKAG